MNLEVHKNLLANHPDAFATNRTKAMDQLVGYESIKSRSNNNNNNSSNITKNDVSESVVLVNATGNNANNEGCWYCHEEGHYRVECPKCLAALSNSDTVKTTMLIHLGDGGDNDDDLSPQDDLDEKSVDEEGLEMDALCFHISVCFDEVKAVDPEDVEDLPDVDEDGNVVNGNVSEPNNDLPNVDFEGNIVPIGTNGLEVLDEEDDEYVFGHHNEYNTDDLPSLNAVMNKVMTHQNKPSLWAG